MTEEQLQLFERERRAQRIVVLLPAIVDGETMDEWVQSGNVISPHRPERFRIGTSKDPTRTEDA